MSLNLISNNRKPLMAIAMLWIAIYHSYFPLTFKPFSFVLSKCGYGGVDLFIFLSGFGIYYACKKENDYLVYIKRRLLKILPYSIPLCILSALLNGYGMLDTIIDCLGLSIYFRNNLIGWYVSFILLMYLISPLYYKVFKRKPVVITITVCSFVFLVSFLVDTALFSYVYMRATVYFLGFCFAHFNENNKINSKWCWLLVFVMIIGWIIMYTMYHYFGNDVDYIWPMFLITPGTLLLFAWVVEKTKYLKRFLEYIGDYTFQFYLIHLEVIKILYSKYDLLYIEGVGFDWWLNLFGIVISFILAVVFKKLIDTIINVIINLKWRTNK